MKRITSSLKDFCKLIEKKSNVHSHFHADENCRHVIKPNFGCDVVDAES